MSKTTLEAKDLPRKVRRLAVDNLVRDLNTLEEPVPTAVIKHRGAAGRRAA